MTLTPSQRQDALRSVADYANELGMPEGVYVAEHGVTIIANRITAARWSGVRGVPAGGRMAPVTVQAVEPLVVA